VQMDEYVSLPAQRLAHLVRKYVHHVRMKEIEGEDHSHRLRSQLFSQCVNLSNISQFQLVTKQSMN